MDQNTIFVWIIMIPQIFAAIMLLLEVSKYRIPWYVFYFSFMVRYPKSYQSVIKNFLSSDRDGRNDLLYSFHFHPHPNCEGCRKGALLSCFHPVHFNHFNGTDQPYWLCKGFGELVEIIEWKEEVKVRSRNHSY